MKQISTSATSAAKQVKPKITLRYTLSVSMQMSKASNVKINAALWSLSINRSLKCRCFSLKMQQGSNLFVFVRHQNKLLHCPLCYCLYLKLKMLLSWPKLWDGNVGPRRWNPGVPPNCPFRLFNKWSITNFRHNIHETMANEYFIFIVQENRNVQSQKTMAIALVQRPCDIPASDTRWN